MTDSAENLAGSTEEVLTLGGTVTANTAATAAQATTIASYEAVVDSVSDTAEAIAALGAPARNEAVNITASGTANVDQTTIQGASNTGTSTITRIVDSSEAIAASTDAAALAGTVISNFAATAGQATTIAS